MENGKKGERMLPNCGEEEFFSEQSEEILRAVCRGIGGKQCPAVYVSESLMVLGQTKAGGELFAEATFYSIESFLPHEANQLIRQCLEQHTEQEQQVLLNDSQWNMRVIPVNGGGAVLVFAALQHNTAGVTLATADLRDRSASLLMRADYLDEIGHADVAAEIRREAYRILRSVCHLELLAGAPEKMQWAEYTISAFMEEMQKQIERRRAKIRILLPHGDAKMQADAHLLRSAILSLVSNSLRHGGEQVQVAVSVELTEKNVTFRVDDTGVGISDAVMQRMNNTWELQDALPGGWGLGIPYVRRIAMMHRGVLVYVQTAEAGTHARLRIPLRQNKSNLLESSGVYQRIFIGGSDEVDIELSSALDAMHFQRD